MRSSPSVYFILILNNHRLIYFPETPHAPDLKEFKTTTTRFLEWRHKEFIDQLYEKMKTEGLQITKKALRKTHPAPTLEVIALAGAENVAQFIRRFEKLKSISFRLVKPNPDIDAGETLARVREFAEKLNAERTSVTTANSEGLNIPASINAVTEVAESGNQEITLSGVDYEGNRLKGNNNRFRISTPVDNIPLNRRDLIDRLYAVYQGLIGTGAIRVPSLDETMEKIRQLVRLL